MPEPRLRQAVHQLWLPAGSNGAAVEQLVVSRCPGSVRTEDGLSISRHSSLVFPACGARGALVWTARTLRERDEPVRPGRTDPDGLYRVFAQGMPLREERRVVDLLLGLARRLGGGLLVDVDENGGRPLPVDPLARIDLRVLSMEQLSPEMVRAAVVTHEPTARLAMDGVEWEGPLVDRSGDPGALVARMSAQELARVDAVCSASDARALAHGDVLDAYALEIDLDADGVLVVEAHAEDDPPPQVLALGWTDVVAYDVRWVARDETEAESDVPDERHCAARAAVRPRLHLVARTLVEMASGMVLDASGFVVDRYEL